MTHLSENSKPLTISIYTPLAIHDALEHLKGFSDVLIVRLPTSKKSGLNGIGQFFSDIVASLADGVTLITIGETVDLVKVHSAIEKDIRYQSWIVLKSVNIKTHKDKSAVDEAHFGALIHTKYPQSLRHTKTRIQYTYCPACDKTTKDYGGKKHTYHEYGTLLSDVWRDVSCDIEDDLSGIYQRFADFFGIENYQELRVIDCRSIPFKRQQQNRKTIKPDHQAETAISKKFTNRLFTGDCLEELRRLPDNSVDFAFADPPYNLKKVYAGYADDLEIARYFEWCDEWITELSRVLKDGRTLALLNIPLWSIRHFLHLEKTLSFQNWIAWDALSYPVRMLMPAHYAILCFSKGKARTLPGLVRKTTESTLVLTSDTPSLSDEPSNFLSPLNEGFCLRSQCVNLRRSQRINDRTMLSDIWSDIHRLKHNTRRVDHPCQLPPQLMYRLISLYTSKEEVVLDCFNGAGTTTLTAHQLGRRYIGIEKESSYTELALSRHSEILQGLDPFRKVERTLTAKNSPVPRLAKQKYDVSKKTLQLEVKRVANKLNRLPSREDIIEYGKYQISYYDDYFVSWGEVCAAARTTGMTETRNVTIEIPSNSEQLKFFDF